MFVEIQHMKSSDVCCLVTVNFYMQVAPLPLFKIKAYVNSCNPVTAFCPLRLTNLSHAGYRFKSSSAQAAFVQITPHLQTWLLAILPSLLLGYS